ncbi:hypothetical protein F2Q68_00030836 [Brassica cretica]|uniref:Uncharacterized protein n=1 Tax=Brassica cretica TaxID=69181 RepID=A0A8S9G4J1_BRACR|nr:hypothetical protein F2Q68_00030836 [Brassica cretica]
MDRGARGGSMHVIRTLCQTLKKMSVYISSRRCCPERDQFDGFRSVKVLKFDTPLESPKNCPEAIEDSVRLQISPSRPVSFFMIKPRFCPSRDQFSPVQSSRPLGFGKVFSDKPAAYRHRTLVENLVVVILLEGHCFLKLPPESPIEERGTAIQIEDRGTAIPIEDRDHVIPDRLRLCGVMVKRLPVSLVWRKNDFWMNWSKSWSKFCDSGRIIPSPSRSASGPWCWVGRGGPGDRTRSTSEWGNGMPPSGDPEAGVLPGMDRPGQNGLDGRRSG